MLISTVKKIFGTRNDRELKRMRKVVARINALEEAMQALDDSTLCAKTDEFRSRLSEGEKLDQLLPEAFAVVREAGVRALGMRHFDVQLIGGMVLPTVLIVLVSVAFNKARTALRRQQLDAKASTLPF